VGGRGHVRARERPGKGPQMCAQARHRKRAQTQHSLNIVGQAPKVDAPTVIRLTAWEGQVVAQALVLPTLSHHHNLAWWGVRNVVLCYSSEKVRVLYSNVLS
jgi:hypothetical protein